MTKQKVPVTAKVIKWARTHHELDITEVADRLSISVGKLKAIEAGDEFPGITIFRGMRDLYKLPEAYLLRKTIPQMPSDPRDHRTLDGRPATTSVGLRHAIRKVRTLQDNLIDLATELPEVIDWELPSYKKNQKAEIVAQKERQRLNVSFEDQLYWDDEKAAFDNLREVLQTQGIYVYLETWPLDDCRAFTLQDSGAPPAIVISKKEKIRTAWLFSLMHEYAHLLLGEQGIPDERNRKSPVERFCNEFAAEFLIPKALLNNIWPVVENEPVEWTVDDVRSLAWQLKVSQQSIALRLEELGRAPKGFFERFRKLQQTQGDVSTIKPKPGKGSGHQPNMQAYALGNKYTKTVLLAWHKKIINRVEATRMLQIRSTHFKTFAKRLGVS